MNEGGSERREEVGWEPQPITNCPLIWRVKLFNWRASPQQTSLLHSLPQRIEKNIKILFLIEWNEIKNYYKSKIDWEWNEQINEIYWMICEWMNNQCRRSTNSFISFHSRSLRMSEMKKWIELESWAAQGNASLNQLWNEKKQLMKWCVSRGSKEGEIEGRIGMICWWVKGGSSRTATSQQRRPARPTTRLFPSFHLHQFIHKVEWNWLRDEMEERAKANQRKDKPNANERRECRGWIGL